MLKAYTHKQNLINILYMTDKLILKKLKETEKFYCPICKSEVILKIGKVIIPHFAHMSNANCTIKNESTKHLIGKRDLSMWLTSQGIENDVEVMVSKSNRIADILVRYKGIYYAIEYQCSTIPANEVIKRSNDYYKAKIIPIWIIGRKQNFEKVTDFELIFSRNKHLIYYDNGFFIKYIYTNTTKNKFICNNIKLFRDEIKFDNLVNCKFSELKNIESNLEQLYIKSIDNDKWKSIRYLIKYNKKFAKMIYINNIKDIYDIKLFSQSIKGQIIINEAPILWQIYLITDFLKKGKTFSRKELYYFIHKEFKIRKMPFEKNITLYKFVDEIINYWLVNKCIFQNNNIFFAL